MHPCNCTRCFGNRAWLRLPPQGGDAESYAQHTPKDASASNKKGKEKKTHRARAHVSTHAHKKGQPGGEPGIVDLIRRRLPRRPASRENWPSSRCRTRRCGP